MVKYTVIFIFLVLSPRLFAQHLNGTVADAATKLPIEYATVNTGHSVAFTTAEGKFSLNNIRFGDTVRITTVGYKPYTFAVYKSNDTVMVYLEPNNILLNDVTITGARNYKADSLKLREEYAKEFNYHKPAIKDFLKTKLPGSIPDHGVGTNNSTPIGGIDLLSVAALFFRNKAPSAKFQKQLQQDEQENYIDHLFSKSKVTLITNMTGDSLEAFMSLYRPTVTQVKTMTDYDIMQYIKASYQQFILLYVPGEKSIFSK